MQKLDDATAHMTFLAMVADLQRAWQVHLDAPDNYFGVVRKLIIDWWEMTNRGEETPRFEQTPAEFTEDWRRAFCDLVKGLADSLESEPLMRAIKLYLLNEELWDAESTTFSPYLQGIFAEAFPERDSELVAWVNANIVNPWAHLRFHNQLAESYADYSSGRRAWDWVVEREEELRKKAKADRLAKRATLQLHKCVARGDVAAVKALLAKGADVEAVVAEHGSLESIARANGRVKMVEFLETGA